MRYFSQQVAVICGECEAEIVAIGSGLKELWGTYLVIKVTFFYNFLTVLAGSWDYVSLIKSSRETESKRKKITTVKIFYTLDQRYHNPPKNQKGLVSVIIHVEEEAMSCMNSPIICLTVIMFDA